MSRAAQTLVACFLSLALPAAARALCPSNARVEVGDSWLQVVFETDTPGMGTQIRLQYGATPNMERRGMPERANHATVTARYLDVTDVLPGLPKLYFDPQVSTPGGKQWSDYAACQAQLCPSAGEQPGGYACEDDGRGTLIPFVSTPEDTGRLDLPRLPRHARPDPRKRPEIDGGTTTLADCSGLQAALNDHADGGSKDTNQNHEIRLPRGKICRPEQERSAAGENLASYILPPKSGRGVTIVTCDWEADAAPPPGVQYEPRLRTDSSCGFGLNHATVGNDSAFASGGALVRAPECNSPPCTQGWRFETLVVEAGDWRDFSPRKVAVKSVDIATGKIKLAQPLATHHAKATEVNLNLPGIKTMIAGNDRNLQFDMGQRGCLAAPVSSDELKCWGFNAMTGAYEGGGSVSAAQGYEIESCTSASGDTTCTLREDHGLGSFPSFPVVRLSGDLLQLDAEAHGWTRNATILIEGNSDCDGLYVMESKTALNSAKLKGAACSGTGGVARRLYTGRFFDLEGPGADALEGVHLVDFPGPNQVRAYGADLGGAAIETGGFVYTNPKISAFFELPKVSRVTFDRVLFDIGKPFRVFHVFGLSSTQDGSLACDCAILDSYVDGLHFWLPISPGLGAVEPGQTFRPLSSIPVFVRAHVIKDLHLDGITFANSSAFAYFADQFGSPGPQDVTLRRLSMTYPLELLGGPDSKGVAHNLRHFIETKGGVRLLVEGVDVRNWPAVGIPVAAPIYFSYRSALENSKRLMQDLTMRNVFMRSVAAGIGVSENGAEAFAPHEPMRRVLIDNWLLDGIHYPNLQSAPHGQGLEFPGTFYKTRPGGGFALWFGGPMEDVKVSRVTARRMRTKLLPNFLSLAGGRSNGIQIDRSILSYSPAGAQREALAPYAYQTNRMVPPVESGGARGFNEWATRMGRPDPRSWFGTPTAPVGIIPCLRDSSLPRALLQEKNNVKGLAEQAFACKGDDCDRWHVRIAGKDGQSCAEREALVLDQDLNGIGPFEGLGADTSELAKALGYIPAEIRDITTTGAKILYQPLSNDACTVDHSRDPEFRSYVRGHDPGGEGVRALQMDGYSPGETAYYRVLCPRAVPVWGEFETAEAATP